MGYEINEIYPLQKNVLTDVIPRVGCNSSVPQWNIVVLSDTAVIRIYLREVGL